MSERKKAAKGTLAFWITYASLSVILCAAIAIGLHWFSRFLADYEAHDEERTVKSFLDELSETEYAGILENINFTPTVFEDADVYRNTYLMNIGEELGYSKNLKSSTNENPVYVIKSGKNQIAEVYLKMSDEVSEFGFRDYEIDRIVTGDIETGSVSISAPNTAAVYINGIKLDDSYVVNTSPPFENVKYFYDYIKNPPYMVTYQVDGLLNEPEITAFMGETPIVMEQYNTFNLPAVVDEDIYQMAIDFSLTYSKYIACDTAFSNVSAYIPHELKLYDDLLYYENEFYAWHTDYEFEDVEASNLIFYTPDCFSINVKYTHIIHSTEIFTFPADNTIYFTRIGDEWKVTELVME